jgi:hypothetical protein
MNELEPVQNLEYALSAPMFDRIAAQTLAICRNNLVETREGPQTLVHIDGATKQILSSRQAYLLRQIKSHDLKAKAALIADMLKCYGERRDENLKMTVATFVSELRDIPTWAVSLACQAIKVGAAAEVSPSYRPTTIQVVLVARRYLSPTLTELHSISDVLRATPYVRPMTEDEREVVRGRLQTFAEEFRLMTSEREIFERDARRARQHDERAKRDEQAILRSYGKRKPIYAGQFLVSPSLIRAIRAA